MSTMQHTAGREVDDANPTESPESRPAGQHVGARGSDEQPREQGTSPSNFVSAGQVVEKIGNLHGRLIAVLRDLSTALPSERDRLLIESWIRDEQRVAVTLGEQLEALDGRDGLSGTEGASRFDAQVQYARLDAFEQAVAELEATRSERVGAALERAERANELLIRALRQLAGRVEHSGARELFQSLAELEEGNARRRSDDENSSRTL